MKERKIEEERGKSRKRSQEGVGESKIKKEIVKGRI